MKKSLKLLTSISLIIIITASLTACSASKEKKEEAKSGNNSENTSVTSTVDGQSKDQKSADNVSDTEQSTTVTPTVTPVLTEEEQIRQDMINRSLVASGNNYRIKKVIEKARRGEDVTLAYIGGSITEGFNAGTTEIFAKLSYEYFADTYGTRDTVHYVNAGLSGTPSTLGLIRSDRDIFAYKPDIIFIEFAVNDSQSGIDPAAFESLIAKALKQENEPAVVLLFSVIESGYTCQTQMQLTGFNYKLPMISIKNVLQPEFDAGRMKWRDWSNDQSHPNEFGHKLYSEFIINYFKTVDTAKLDEPAQLPKRFVSRVDYTGMTMIDKNNTEVLDLGSFHEESGHNAFPNGWVKAQGTSENKAFKFKITGKSLFVVYKEVNDDTLGRAEIFVDGELITNLAGNTSAGWYNPTARMIFHNQETAEHTVEIKMAAGDEDKGFDILALGYCP